MRVSLAVTGVLALLLAGCAQEPDGRGGPANATAATADTSTEADLEQVERGREALGQAPLDSPALRMGRGGRRDGVPPLPDVAPENAPDVAFDYRYNFALAADSIAPVQQRHARLCEELGTRRCRVTGMSHRRTGEEEVTAELRLALDPLLAHRFGERALEGVQEADGMLIDSQLTGTDVGSNIREAGQALAGNEEQLAELERRIAAAPNARTRQALQAEADALRARSRGIAERRSEERQALATTPMLLSYDSRAYAAAAPDFGGAMAGAWDQLMWGAYGLFVVAMALFPWALGLALILLAIRGLRRRQAPAAGEPVS